MWSLNRRARFSFSRTSSTASLQVANHGARVGSNWHGGPSAIQRLTSADHGARPLLEVGERRVAVLGPPALLLLLAHLLEVLADMPPSDGAPAHDLLAVRAWDLLAMHLEPHFLLDARNFRHFGDDARFLYAPAPVLSDPFSERAPLNGLGPERLLRSSSRPGTASTGTATVVEVGLREVPSLRSPRP
jgi:hypothetical protein